MPEISRFFGIVILMYHGDHNPPHFHARYAGQKISIEIETLRVMDGVFPGRALGLVVEWAQEHKAELMAAWEQAVNGESPPKIDPLN